MKLAKSLHTITVLVNVGMFWYDQHRHLPLKPPDAIAQKAVFFALEILKLDGKDDEYGLAETAAAQIEKLILADKRSA